MNLTRNRFVPSHSARHRTAALALYRALVKAARAVPLPPSIHATTTASPAAEGSGSAGAKRHAVAQLVRRRFDRNKLDTSLRLVYYSMTAGYKFLTFLTKAQTHNSKEHTRLLDILRTRNETASHSRAIRPPPRQKKEPRPPLLVNVAQPGEPPRYTATPRPKTSFPGARRVPNLAAISYGFPFLQYTKPQPAALTAMIASRRSQWIKTVAKVKALENTEAPAAALEDEWEYLVRNEMRHGKRGGTASYSRESEEERLPAFSETFLWSSSVGQLWKQYTLDRLVEDWAARGQAMYKLLKAERALAEEEGQTVRHQRLGSAPALDEAPPSDPPTNRNPTSQIQVTETAQMHIQNERTVAQDLGDDTGLYYSTHDHFVSPIWAGMVENAEPRLRKWSRVNPSWKPEFARREATPYGASRQRFQAERW